MAGPRLGLLLPPLIRPWDAAVIRSTRAAARYRAFHRFSSRQYPESLSQRYGAANEPPPHLEINSPSKSVPADVTPDRGQEIMTKASETDAQSKGDEKEPVVDDAKRNKAKRPAKEDKPIESLLDAIPSPSQVDKRQVEQRKGNNKVALAPTTTSRLAQEPSTIDSHPNTDSPPSQAPHLETPRYSHHFDTYSLVRRLHEGGWTDEQSVTLMKAMRLQLAANLDLANQALVSKSMVENETYLFRAACAELKTEVTSRRRAEQDKMRTERTQLHHEVDILSQGVGQEMAGLKDDLRGMFDDRKMSVRNEQRMVESRLQEINYKITVALQADAKSDVEGLRWVMTRRVIIALGAVIFMVVGSLKLYSNAVHEAEMDAKRRANARSGGTQTDDRDFATSTGSSAGELLVKVNEGDNPSFVSLG